MNWETVYQSSLAKIFPDRTPDEPCLRKISAWRGERMHFQAVFRPDFSWGKVSVKIVSPLAENVRIRSVELVPVDYLPANYDADSVYHKPGLYPDLLKELPENTFSTVVNQWRSIWITADIPDDLPAGDYPLAVEFHAFDIVSKQSAVFSGPVLQLCIQARKLPPQTLKNTHWFHCDSIAEYYGVEIFSEAHWELIANFMRAASACGINMILTPVVTPPLDTEIGSARAVVQLVDVFCDGGNWRFDFSKLARWCELAESCGITYFECAHLFTQWGAKFSPKIMAVCDGALKQIAGWKVSSDSPEYVEFLSAFLPALARWIDERGLRSRFYFHCSDEPRKEDCETYGRNFALLEKLLPGMKIFDALSRPEIYESSGRKTIPVVCEHHLQEFNGMELPERWTYYCCEPFADYPNRFIYMQSWRNRILGALLYRYDMEGFLHWGFNFYYSRLCRFQVDPHCNTTSGGAFPAGDGFIVYPGGDGNAEFSLRAEVFYDALQDMRCLQQLEAEFGREKVCRFLDSYAANGTLSMTDFAVDRKFFSDLRTWNG